MKIARDKWIHFIVGIPMGLVITALAHWLFPNNLLLSVSMAAVVVVAISYGFELLSLVIQKGVYELEDALASIIGGFTGFCIFWLMEYFT